MTMTSEHNTVCCVCGKENLQPVILSTNAVGEGDLDELEN